MWIYEIPLRGLGLSQWRTFHPDATIPTNSFDLSLNSAILSNFDEMHFHQDLTEF